jgi:hypothetical protein
MLDVGCRGGGGVDGAIHSTGGPNLGRDRAKLPAVAVTDAARLDGSQRIWKPAGSIRDPCRRTELPRLRRRS